MKISNLVFILVLLSFLCSPNVHAQRKELSIEKGEMQLKYDSNYKNSILDKLKNSPSRDNCILNIERISTELLIDTVITTKADGDMGKHIYTYNQDYKKVIDLSLELDGTIWKNLSRYSFTYDINGKTLSELYERWDGVGWKNSRLETYTYDINSNLTLHLIENWNGTEWVGYERYSWNYDINGNKILELFERMNENVWTNSGRNTWEYDSNGNMILFLHEWYYNNWINGYQEFYSYDMNGNALSKLTQIWDGGDWKNSQRITNAYDLNNRLISEVYENWNMNAWVNVLRNTYTFDANNILVNKLNEEWDGANWKSAWRDRWIYDVNNNITSWFLDKWSTSGWWTNMRKNFTYIEDKYLTFYISEYFGGMNWVLYNQPISIFDSFGNEFFFETAKIEIVYKSLTNIQGEDLVSNDFVLSQNYPNPFNPSTKIYYSIKEEGFVSLKVYDVLGKEVASIVNENQPAGNYEVDFSASTLASGVYMYTLQASGFTSSKKMLLMK